MDLLVYADLEYLSSYLNGVYQHIKSMITYANEFQKTASSLSWDDNVSSEVSVLYNDIIRILGECLQKLSSITKNMVESKLPLLYDYLSLDI